MEIERIAEILIYFIHAPLGGIALLAGGISLIAKKGNNVHKKSGRVFFFSMLFSAISAIIISVLPNHESPFLFSIGLFSTYVLISGLRSLKFKQKEFQLKTEKIIAYLITLTGIVMILYPALLFSKLNIILTVFGVVGIVFGLRDLKLFKDIKSGEYAKRPVSLSRDMRFKLAQEFTEDEVDEIVNQLSFVLFQKANSPSNSDELMDTEFLKGFLKFKFDEAMKVGDVDTATNFNNVSFNLSSIVIFLSHCSTEILNGVLFFISLMLIRNHNPD